MQFSNVAIAKELYYSQVFVETQVRASETFSKLPRPPIHGAIFSCFLK